MGSFIHLCWREQASLKVLAVKFLGIAALGAIGKKDQAAFFGRAICRVPSRRIGH